MKVTLGFYIPVEHILSKKKKKNVDCHGSTQKRIEKKERAKKIGLFKKNTFMFLLRLNCINGP